MPGSKNAEAQGVKAEVQQTELAVSPNDINVTAIKPHNAGIKKNGYHVLCCGNSWQDLLIIPLCLITVYTLLGALFALCTRSVLQTDDTNTALWMFFGVYAFCIFLLAFVLGTVAYKRKLLEAYNDSSEER